MKFTINHHTVHDYFKFITEDYHSTQDFIHFKNKAKKQCFLKFLEHIYPGGNKLLTKIPDFNKYLHKKNVTTCKFGIRNHKVNGQQRLKKQETISLTI